MSKTIRIRHVPDALYQRLEQLAADAETTLSDFLLREFERMAGPPTGDEMPGDEMMQRLESLEPVRSGESSVDAVRAVRGD